MTALSNVSKSKLVKHTCSVPPTYDVSDDEVHNCQVSTIIADMPHGHSTQSEDNIVTIHGGNALDSIKNNGVG